MPDARGSPRGQPRRRKPQPSGAPRAAPGASRLPRRRLGGTRQATVPASGTAPGRGTAEAPRPGRAAVPVERGGRGGRAGPGRAVPGARAGEEPGGGGAEPRSARPRPEGTWPWRRYLGQRRRARPEPPEGTEPQVRAGCAPRRRGCESRAGGAGCPAAGQRGSARSGAPGGVRSPDSAALEAPTGPPRRAGGVGRGGGGGGPGLGCGKGSERIDSREGAVLDGSRRCCGPWGAHGGGREAPASAVVLVASAARSAHLYSW